MGLGIVNLLSSINKLIRPGRVYLILHDCICSCWQCSQNVIYFYHYLREFCICFQRYRRGQRGGRTFQRGGSKHFNNRAQTRNDSESSDATDTAKNQTKEQSQEGDSESKAEDPTRLENGADPLSLVLDGSYNEEDDAGMTCVSNRK